jgi:large subunit ribosomal protein L24
MKKFKIKRDDVVIVTAGKNKGMTGKVLQVLRERDRVLVEKVNLVTRHIKPRGDQPGGTVEKKLRFTSPMSPSTTLKRVGQ